MISVEGRGETEGFGRPDFCMWKHWIRYVLKYCERWKHSKVKK